MHTQRPIAIVLALVMMFFVVLGTSLATGTSSFRSRRPATTRKPQSTQAQQKRQENPQGPVLRLPNKTSTSRPRPGQAPLVSLEDGQTCTTITFEGVGNLSSIPEFDGISSPGWLGIIDEDAGGSGNIAFEPSPETIAFWLGGNPGARDIVFNKPASKVEFSYASAVTTRLDAFDEMGNLVASATGSANIVPGGGGDPNGDYNRWGVLSVETMGNKIVKITVTGNSDQTGIDNLKVCRAVGLHSVEITQAIQEWQELEQLKTDLQGDREPPVPLIENKPAVLRAYFNQLQAVTNLRVEISGVTMQSQNIQLQPQCTPELYRRGQNGCQSADFYFVPPAGQWSVTIKVFDSSNNMIESQTLPLSSREADDLVLRSVSICDAKDNAGNWQCAQGSQLVNLIDLLQRTAPTDVVRVSTTNHVVRRNTATYDADSNSILNSTEMGNWWNDAIRDVHDLYGLFDALLPLFGQRRYYYGLIRPALPGTVGGKAHDIPSHGAGSRTSAIRLGTETVTEVIAHETGHMLGRKHTNTAVPSAGSAPGCYSLAPDSSTDWPFANNRIQSAQRLEVGFDVSARRPLQPETTFDWMSYCTPRWISPHTYRNAMTSLGASRPSATPVTPSVTGPFWQVSGLINNNQVVFDPLFVMTLNAPADAGTGSHRIEVRTANGTPLFTRFFTPKTVAAESIGGDQTGPPVFAELIPVVSGANHIALLNSNSAEIGRIHLGGATPSVSVTAPIAGASVFGLQTVTWAVTDPDSTTRTAKVLYSADSGANWISLGQVSQDNSLAVDFDQLPGTTNSSLIRVMVSDGVNSNAATSGLFTVSKKAPTAQIMFPLGNDVFRQQDLVWLRGYAYDVDDGFLDGNAIRWESNLDGQLGFGANLPKRLSPGIHTITLFATDSNANSVSRAVTFSVAGAPPTLDLTIRPLNTLPTTCVEAIIDAQAGSISLTTVEYSLNGGTSWIAVSQAQLPLRFIVPGQGFFHLVARTFDAAGQLAVKDGRFFIDSPCPCPTITISPANPALPSGNVGFVYSQTFTRTGGAGAITWSVSTGALPSGLTLNAGSGVLSGVPNSATTANFTLRATDANGCTGERAYTLTINGAASGLQFFALPNPVRLLDTRLGASPNACSQPNAAIAGGAVRIQVARNFCGIPANAQAITGNVTTVNSGGGFLTLYPSDATRPTVASTNYGVNEIINNVFTVGLGTGDGAFNIYALNTTDIVVDVTGYYAPPNTGGLYFHPLPAPVRLLETRAGLPVGCFKPGIPLPGGVDTTQQVTGVACVGIPAAARAIVGNATTVGPQSGGYLTLFPADAARPLVASSNYNTGQIVNGPFTVGLSAAGQFKLFTTATTDLVVDVLGYYSTEANDANGAGLLFTPLARPVRLLETRANPPNLTGCFKPNAPLNGQQVYTQTARGVCDSLTIPAAALAVVGNATVVFPVSGGYLTLWPSIALQPTVATSNYNTNDVINRHFIVGLGNADGAFKLFSSATTELVIDLSGYFAP